MSGRKKKALLEKSLVHWEDNLAKFDAGESFHAGASSCPLCMAYRGFCARCPLGENGTEGAATHNCCDEWKNVMIWFDGPDECICPPGGGEKQRWAVVGMIDRIKRELDKHRSEKGDTQ